MWKTKITRSQKQWQIRAYPKNVNLAVLESIVAPKLWEREKKKKKNRERERFEIESFVVLYPRAADSVTPWLSGAELLYYMKTLTHFFPPLVLPMISPPFSNRLYFLTCCICTPDIMWKVE